MQRIEFRLIIFIFILLLSGFVDGHAQNTNQLTELYEQHDFDLLKENIGGIEGSYTKTPEYKFFKAVFIENGEEAQKEYKYVFDYGKGRIKYLAAYKMMDYYFARGYYNTAETYQKYILDNEFSPVTNVDMEGDSKDPGSPPSENGKDEVFIQVGAFGYRENAVQLMDMLSTQNIDSKIIEREINDKKLFCVWINGLENLDDTLKFANEIKEKYDLDFRIIKK
ncbi:MAG: SPOR domain-containing protein [Calditrichaceae bacterium]